jgi:hypothetical protein
MQLDGVVTMDENTGTLTVEASLGALEDVIQKAAADLLASRNALARARAEIVAGNTSLSRTIVGDAERVVDHLRLADEALTSVLAKLAERD